MVIQILQQYAIQKYVLKNLHKNINNKKKIYYPLHVTPGQEFRPERTYDQFYIIQKISNNYLWIILWL